MNEKTFTLELTETEINVVLTALAAGRYQDVAQVVGKIHSQASAQLTPTQETVE